MKIRPDGSILSSNLPVKENAFYKKTEYDSNTYRGIVTKILYSDDEQNVTFNTDNPVVMYEVLITSGDLSGKVVNNVRLSEKYGGSLNFSERVLCAVDKNFKSDSLKDQKEHDGDIVILTFLGGEKGSPIIIGLEKSIKNQKLNLNSAAKKEDGPREIEEFNGIKKEIDKEGSVTLTQKGGIYKAEAEGDYFEPNAELSAFLNELTVDKMGKIDLNLGAGETGAKPININIDPTTEKMILTFKTGTIVTFDGSGDKVVFETSSGAKAEIDGAAGTITLDIGSNKIVIDSSGITLDGSIINAGTGAAFSATLFENLALAFNLHTHIYVSPLVPSAAIPTTPPTLPMNTSVGSKSVKLKS